MSWEQSAEFEAEEDVDIQELHKDLGRKYRNIGSKVDKIWRAFTPKQRETCLRESTGDGQVLRHSRDPGVRGTREFIPEYNLKDMTSSADHFMTIFKFRATEVLQNQLFQGVNGMPGDREVVQRVTMPDAHLYSDQKMLFLPGQHYGKCFESTGVEGRRVLSDIGPRLGVWVLPRAEGEMVIMRQQNLFILLNHLVEEILDLDSETRIKKAPLEKKANKALEKAVSDLSIAPRPLKASFSDVLAQAID